MDGQMGQFRVAPRPPVSDTADTVDSALLAGALYAAFAFVVYLLVARAWRGARVALAGAGNEARLQRLLLKLLRKLVRFLVRLPLQFIFTVRLPNVTLALLCALLPSGTGVDRVEESSSVRRI
jgi:hypothetical protein